MRSFGLAGSLALLLVLQAVAGAPWHHPLDLANGGYWPLRVAVTVTNSAAEATESEPVALSVPALAGAKAESLRVCRADGVELLYEVRDPGGAARHAAALKSDDQLIVPVECPGHTATALYVYAGNDAAWPVPDFLPGKFTKQLKNPGNSRLRVSVGALERLQIRISPPPRPGSGPEWRNRAEVRVRNLSEQPLRTALVRVNLRKALVQLPGLALDTTVSGVASSDGRELPAYRLGTGADLLFGVDLAPLSEQLFQVGFQANPKRQSHAAIEEYERLLVSRVNLAGNGSFEDGSAGPENWIKPAAGGSHQVSAGFSSGARFGKRSLELTALENEKADWLGWTSREIPVRPGATYFLGGWLKAVGLGSFATIHAHFHDARGALTRSGAMVSTQPTVSANSEWVNSTGFFQAPPDAATIQIHLTMNTRGTLRHDGVVLCEVVDGELAHVYSSAQEKTSSGLRAWEVNPLVKVFPDTPPQPEARAVSVELARNEYEPFQLAVRSAAAKTNHLSISVSVAEGPSGASLPAVKIERVAYVPVDYPSAYYSTEVPEWCRKVPRG
ncbi:MAG TPA: hypothetical protein VJA21_21195, partial [Verrucomicrobiae bacterium]